MDGSGDCSEDLLQLHYPDEDIPHELIGFLDDKVSSTTYDHLALAEIIVFFSDHELGSEGKVSCRSHLSWKVKFFAQQALNNPKNKPFLIHILNQAV